MWLGFSFYGFLSLAGLGKLISQLRPQLRSHFQWENLVGTIGSAGFAIFALIELLR